MNNPAINKLQDAVSTEAHGMTRAEAISKSICVDCKQPDALVRCHSDLGRSEYYISGMCEDCWDKLFSEIGEQGG